MFYFFLRGGGAGDGGAGGLSGFLKLLICGCLKEERAAYASTAV